MSLIIKICRAAGGRSLFFLLCRVGAVMLGVLFVCEAFAAAEAVHVSPSENLLSSLPMMLAIAGGGYFLLIRPQARQAKERQALIEGLSAGDEVALSGGVIGKIKQVEESVVVLNIADGVNIVVQKHRVSMVLPKGTYRCV